MKVFRSFATTTAVMSLGAVAAFAADAAAVPAETKSAAAGIVGALGALVLGFVQLGVALTIVTFCIKKGLEIVSGLIGDIDIWDEIKKKNIAIALLAAGAVFCYTKVVGSGIDSMTKSIGALASGSWLGGVSGLVGGMINLFVAIWVASIAITITFRVMDTLTKNIDEKAEFKGGNIAVGAIYCGVLIGVSNLISSGVTGISSAIGLFLNSLVDAFIK